MAEQLAEMLDVINDKDEVIRQATMEEVWDKKLSCRIVHVLIYDEYGKLACQVRSDKKFFCPGCYSTSVGGHMQAGETPEEAAKREMQEEVGITAKVNLLFSSWYEGAGFKKMLYVFKASNKSPLIINKDEVQAIEYLNHDAITKLSGEKLHPELKFIIDKIKDEKN